MSIDGQNCLGQASISTEESDAAGRGVSSVKRAFNDGDNQGHHISHGGTTGHDLSPAADTPAGGNFVTPQLVAMRLYDADEAASQRIAAVVIGAVLTLVVLGLIAVTWVSLAGVSPSGVSDYLRTVGIPLVTAAFSFLTGYKVRGRKMRT
jgi:hypothetical protein